MLHLLEIIPAYQGYITFASCSEMTEDNHMLATEHSVRRNSQVVRK